MFDHVFTLRMTDSIAWPFAFAALGLMVGSFLNVVIHRLPTMLERQWARDCAAFQAEMAASTPLGDPASTSSLPADSYNLLRPSSHCPQCQQAIAWRHKLPLVSYLALGGRCAACRSPISLRYPLVELACGALFYFCAARWGFSVAAVAWAGFSAALLTLALIDWDTTLLPDDITLPLMWAGLLLAALGWNPGLRLADAVWGAALGYSSLWAIYWLFKIVTGKEGMGFGDFKLLAALGAWLGWTALLPLLTLASLCGAVFGLLLKWRGGLREGGYLPFGPCLVLAGFTALVAGPQSFARAVGLGP